MYKRDAKYEITFTWNLISSIIINIYFNYIKRLFFYYLRYPHDIRIADADTDADVKIHADIRGCGSGCGAPIHLY